MVNVGERNYPLKEYKTYKNILLDIIIVMSLIYRMGSNMKESALRDLIASDINKLKSGLTLLKKEQYIPNEFGTRGFIDLYAKDEFGNHVLIEIKRSSAASRDALHEVNKYVEGVKHYFGVKDAEIHVIIASTEWNELLVPFSRFVEDTTFSLQGYEIIVSDNCIDFSARLINPLSTSQGRFIVPWHNMYWYEDLASLESGVQSIQKTYKEKDINDYVLVTLHIQNELSSKERMEAGQAAVVQMAGIDESEVLPLPEIPVYEYIAYTGMQLLPKEKCLQILSRNPEALEVVFEFLYDMEEDETLCYLHGSIEAMEPRPQNNYYEIGYPAKFGKVIDVPNCKILDIVRHGSFARNALLSNETIISELRGEDGSTGQRFKKTISANNTAHLKTLKNEIASSLSENPVWKAHIIRIIEEIQIELPNSEIEISIFNPCTGVFTIYYATTKKDGVLFIPSYYIMVHNPNSDRMYFGALEKTGEALSFPQILDKYYGGDLDDLLLSAIWGGKDSRDSDIIEDLGAQYRSFRCDKAKEGHIFLKLSDDKWRTCEPTDMISLFSEYLKSNEKLVHQINTKIEPRDHGSFICSSSSTIPLDELVDMDFVKKKNQYFDGAPVECDICKCSFEGEKYMIDGKLHEHGVWACMCADCFKAFGEGISWGQGQLYLHSPNGWLLVAGSINNDEIEEF